jgi:serine-type D-Ala-D-Ala carboxypeptidase (penicillin-binding protein 5/6)
MLLKRWSILFLSGFLAFALPATHCIAAEQIRPTGVPAPSSSDDEDADAPQPKKNVSKKKPVRRSAKSVKSDDEPALGTLPNGVPITKARSIMVIDAQSGQILYEKNPDEYRAAASTQKLLTALIVAERGYLDEPVTVQQVDTFAEPVRLNVKPGDTYQRIDLLRALLVKSPNDVARCLARDYAGSVEAFAEVMNRRAQQLGATHSHFVNPNGLPIPGQYSTARDLSLIARAAYANPTIRSIVCMPQYVFRFANGRTRELENTNKVLRRLPYCNGMKTGYTEAAGHCLISSATRPGRDVIAVVLGDSKGGIWRDSAALLSWALWM